MYFGSLLGEKKILKSFYIQRVVGNRWRSSFSRYGPKSLSIRNRLDELIKKIGVDLAF
jgi:hypothetical protein